MRGYHERRCSMDSTSSRTWEVDMRREAEHVQQALEEAG
jgi:hypothetical protein